MIGARSMKRRVINFLSQMSFSPQPVKDKKINKLQLKFAIELQFKKVHWKLQSYSNDI